MECFEFICHAPSDYFRNMSAPYRARTTQPELGFIWSRVGPQIQPLACMADIVSAELEDDPATPSAADRTKATDARKEFVGKKAKDVAVKDAAVKKQLQVKDKIKK